MLAAGNMRHNVGGAYRSATVRALLIRPNPARAAARALVPHHWRVRAREAIRRCDLVAVPPLSAEARGEVMALYQDDIRRLEDLIERDLSHWLAPPTAT